jgi:hypothetical protein
MREAGGIWKGRFEKSGVFTRWVADKWGGGGIGKGQVVGRPVVGGGGQLARAVALPRGLAEIV